MASIFPLPRRLQQYLNQRYGKNKWSFIGFDVCDKGFTSEYAGIKVGDQIIHYNVERYY